MEDKNEQIILSFFEVIKLSQRFAMQKSKKNSNLMIGQYRCLQLLFIKDGRTQKELAKILNIRATSLSETIARLESQEMIRREKSKDDKRTFLVYLTDKGRECAKQNLKDKEKLYSYMLHPLSKEEKEQFGSILNKIKKYYIEQEKEEHAKRHG
ncbi:MAG: MarR family transcriptional regulator [Lachnospiraceae bacterium]|nr:MarR family transcriptional regulator [Lachnospiraceae bacterium]